MLSRRWWLRHALLLLAVGIFLALGRWQWSRADQGNARSFGYAFEWPLFAGFAIFWWWRTLRLELHPPVPLAPIEPAYGPGRAEPAAEPDEEPDDEPDEELAAYNRYLALLHEQDQRQAR